MRPIDGWRRFAADDAMTAAEGAAAVRAAFAMLFLAQTGVALATGGAVAWLAGEAVGSSGGPTGLLGAVLVGLGVLQGPVAVASALAPIPDPDRIRTITLQRALLAAVLLSTPAWYLAFLVATGAGGWPLGALIGTLGLYWFLGVLVATRLGARGARG